MSRIVPGQQVPQGLARFGSEALVQHLQFGDAVQPEGAEVLAQLAPGGEQPHRAVEGERQGPHAASGPLTVLVAVGEGELVALAQGPGPEGTYPGFVDEDGNGICDNFVDEDGDGVCDLRGNGWRNGDGRVAGTPLQLRVH